MELIQSQGFFTSVFKFVDDGKGAADVAAGDFGREGGGVFAEFGEAGEVIFVFFDPFAGEFSGLDFGEDVFHFGSGLVGDESASGEVAAPFGGIGDAFIHGGEAAAVEEINDEAGFVEAFEIGDFGGVSGVDEGLDPGFDEGGDSSAEDGLFAEEVGFGFFAEGGAEDSGSGGADGPCVGEGELFGVAGGILVDGDKGGESGAGEEFGAESVAGAFGGDHGDVVGFGRGDGLVVDIESVAEEEGFFGGEVGGDVGFVNVGHGDIGGAEHDDVGGLGGFGGGEDGKSVLFGGGFGGGGGVEADGDLDSGVAEVLGVGVALGTVADDGDVFFFDEVGVDVGGEEEVGHLWTIMDAISIQ